MRETIGSANESIRGILQADQTRLQRSLESLERAERIAHTARPEIIVNGNRIDQGSRVIFGTDTSQPQFNLNVSDNGAGPGAVASAGVYTPQTLQVLLRDSRASDPAFALQALRTQLQSTNAPGLWSVLHNLSGGPSEATHPAYPRISESTNPSVISAPTQPMEPMREEATKHYGSP